MEYGLSEVLILLTGSLLRDIKMGCRTRMSNLRSLDLKTRLAPRAQVDLFGRAEAGQVGAVGGAVVIDTCRFAGEEEFAIKRTSQLAAHLRG